MSYDFLKDLDEISSEAYEQGKEDMKQRAIEVLSSILENWMHGADEDYIIAEFEEKLT